MAGVIVAHGSHAGGYAMFLEDGRLHFTYNYLATRITTVTAEVTLPTEPLTISAVFTRIGAGGEVELYYGAVAVGRGHVDTTTPSTYGTTGFAVGFQPGGPIRAGLIGRAELSPEVLRKVVVEISDRDPIRTIPVGSRVDLATQ
jgi:arylsulfatase